MYFAILEDDNILAIAVQKFLRSNGHSSKIFNDGLELQKSLISECFDFFILDWMVPGMSGIDILRHIRKDLELKQPVMFLTSLSAEEEIVLALELGADDYCVKPLDNMQFLSRIVAIQWKLKPSLTASAEHFDRIGYRFIPAKHVVIHDYKEIILTEKEFYIALILFKNLDSPISREKIMLEVWGEVIEEYSRSMDVHVTRIRRKLNIGAHGDKLRINSVYGHGYRLMQTFAN
jgi:two-component system, OmpR family, response regulator RegX3